MQESNMSTILGSVTQAVIDGDLEQTIELTQRTLDEGTDPLDIFHRGLIPGMEVVGKKMKAGEYYIPEVLLSARAMREATALIKPRLGESNALEPIGRVVFGTVKDDLHDLGKNMVIMMLEGVGFQVTDLGVDVSADKFVAAVQKEKPDILGLSALLSVTIINMRGVIEALREAGCRQSVKVIVGGAIVSQSFADDIGADGYAPDAVSAVEVAKELLEEG
ncbi:B12-binding domain-containing protein [Chloroflexota bacterium]